MLIGYTKAFRKELNSDIWKMPPLYQRVFFYLRQSASWETDLFPTKKGFKIALNPGQLITSLSVIAEGVSWYEYGVKRVPNRKTIKDILGWLESNAMVTVVSNRHGTFIIIMNWDAYNHCGTEKVTPNKQHKVTPKKQSLDTLKEVKETKELKNKNLFVEDSNEFQLASYFFELIRQNNPKAKHPNLQTWSKEFDMILRVDSRDFKDVRKIIEWCQRDTFWQSNILSPKKLRQQFDRLSLRANGPSHELQEQYI